MKSSDIDQDLFTDSYCKVCSAQLISESQRVAHYEVRTSPVPCFQMEERVAWVTAVGLKASPFLVVWQILRIMELASLKLEIRPELYGVDGNWGPRTSFLDLGCFTDLFYSLYLSLYRLVGLCLWNLSELLLKFTLWT